MAYKILQNTYQSDPGFLDQSVLWKVLSKKMVEPGADLQEISMIIYTIVNAKPSVVDASIMSQDFITPLIARASDLKVSIDDRLELAGWLAREQRNGTFGTEKILIPSVKFPPIDLGPNTSTYRKVSEDMLLHGNVAELLGDGILGKAFPEILGDHTDGGIVGRIQHSAHDFTVDVHTLKIINDLRIDPRFSQLPEEQQVDLLWAALLHDVGKSEGAVDRNQAMKSEAMAWKVVKSLGYSDPVSYTHLTLPTNREV